MDHKELKSQQKRILSQIDKRSSEAELQQSVLLQSLSNYDAGTIEKALGNFGVRLSGFAAEVDFAHPDLANIYDSVFADEEFRLDVLNLLDIASGVLTPFVAENLSRVIGRHLRIKQLSGIDLPSKNLRHARLTKPEVRTNIRKQKLMQNVDLRVLAKKGKEAWDESPQDFSSYIRNGNRLLPLIEEATQQHQHFTKFGLTSMASEIESQLSKLVSESEDDSYYGFNRITMTHASVILGHMHEASFEVSFSVRRGGFSSGVPGVSSRIKYKQFEGNEHFDSLSQEFSLDYFQYKPIIIPATQMERVPGEMVSLMQKLDEWPEALGKPIFDHFWVMLPEINLTGQWDLMYDLLEDDKLAGVLLGEKDGDVYFVSYWM